jgi:phosphate transport system substrate-binding protein
VTSMSQLPLGSAFHPRVPLGKLAAGLAVAFGLAATALPALAQPKQTQETVVRLAGSSTIGTKMALELATAWAKQLKLPAVRIDAGIDADEYEVIAEGAESTRRLRVQVRAKGTGTGLEPLLRGQADFWMASRQVRESDLDAMRKRNVPSVPSLAQMQQPGTENVVGLAALAVVVSPRNPVPSLSYAQLRDIFSGRVTSWAQVGGPSNTPIGLYSPEPVFSTADSFCASIMATGDTQRCIESFPRLAAPRFALMEDLSDAVAGNPAAIGFTDLSLRRSARAVPVGTECGTPVEPSLFRIKTDEYPLSRRLFFYAAPGRQLSPAARDFLQLTLSPAGQTAVAASGLGDLAPGISDANYGSDRLDTSRETMDGGHTRVRASDARAFETATASADRLSITFRFQAGSNNLDSRAEADLGRLIALMQQPNYTASSLTLIGYSGVAGDYAENRTLSRERADAVRDRLIAGGVQSVSSIGVGPAAAVACNLDANTTALNQRVEVWIRKPRAG